MDGDVRERVEIGKAASCFEHPRVNEIGKNWVKRGNQTRLNQNDCLLKNLEARELEDYGLGQEQEWIAGPDDLTMRDQRPGIEWCATMP